MPVRFGEFVFDSATRELSRGGEPVPLAPKAFDLLQVLIEERPRAMRKEELRERLWPNVVVDEANLKNLIGEIRAALDDKKVIRTVHRYGYAFVADLKSSEEATSARLIEGDRIHRLKSGENLIGRDEDCAVVLDFTGVSRHHAKVTVQNDRFILEDLGSKNGTWKNEERLRESVDLRDGDRIRIGGVPLIFRSQSRPVTTATVRGA